MTDFIPSKEQALAQWIKTCQWGDLKDAFYAGWEARGPETSQAPIAKVIVREDGPADVMLYAPGLPPGEHDLYCEPPAPGGQKVPHPCFESAAPGTSKNQAAERARKYREERGHWGTHAEALCAEVERLQRDLNLMTERKDAVNETLAKVVTERNELREAVANAQRLLRAAPETGALRLPDDPRELLVTTARDAGFSDAQWKSMFYESGPYDVTFPSFTTKKFIALLLERLQGKTRDDSARLDWVLLNVSGAEWLRLGIIYSAGMTREHLDRRIAPDVSGEH